MKAFRKRGWEGGSVKVKLDLFNYVTKADLKNATGVDTLKFARGLL